MNTMYAGILKKYKDKPADFVADILGIELKYYQKLFLNHYKPIGNKKDEMLTQIIGGAEKK